ncbi:hypothetical protein BDR05DRAFT_992811, partial [Suillus weaverae]
MAEWLRREIRTRDISYGFRAQVQILLVSFLPQCRELVPASARQALSPPSHEPRTLSGTPSFSSALILPYIPGVIILRMTTINLVRQAGRRLRESDQNDNAGKPMAQLWNADLHNL